MIRAYERAAEQYWEDTLGPEMQRWFKQAPTIRRAGLEASAGDAVAKRLKKMEKSIEALRRSTQPDGEPERRPKQSRANQRNLETRTELVADPDVNRLRDLVNRWPGEGFDVEAVRGAATRLLKQGRGREAIRLYRFPRGQDERAGFAHDRKFQRTGERLERAALILAEIFGTLEDFPKALDPELSDTEARAWCVLYAHRLGMLACRLNMAAVDEAALSRSEGGATGSRGVSKSNEPTKQFVLKTAAGYQGPKKQLVANIRRRIDLENDRRLNKNVSDRVIRRWLEENHE